MRSLFIVPLVIFLLFAMMLMAKLLRTDTKVPSPLIGTKLPEFVLHPLYKGQGAFISSEIKGEYFLVNIFGSWCVACRIEHPYLMELKQENKIKIYAINWRDSKENAKNWLKLAGNPYEKIGYDYMGKAIVDLGVKGAPETFLVSPEGIILYNHAGVLDEEIFEDEFMPLMKK